LTVFFLVSGAGLSFFACGQDPGPGSSSTGAGGTRDCHDIKLAGEPCDPCLYEKCCAQLSACDDDCVNCLLGGSTCSDRSNAVFKCADKLCLTECSGHPNTTTTSSGTGGAGGSATTTGTGGAGGAGGK
jgi:hypothetical protein